MAKGELRLFAVKRGSTDQMLLVAGRSKFEACEALAEMYPDEAASDFEFVPDSVLASVLDSVLDSVPDSVLVQGWE